MYSHKIHNALDTLSLMWFEMFGIGVGLITYDPPVSLCYPSGEYHASLQSVGGNGTCAGTWMDSSLLGGN